jgi:uncharacterized membrane-anchored protein
MVVLRVAAAVVLVLVGLVALTMARNGLTAKRLLPFHQAGTGRTWDDASPGEQSVALALTRALGLGFLAGGLALVTAGVTAVIQADVATYALAAMGLVFCAGLGVINRRLTRETSVGTPWKGSLYAALAIVGALALYVLSHV